MESAFSGEDLLPGILGRAFVFIAFVSALLSAVACYFSVQSRGDLQAGPSWAGVGRTAFFVHVASVLAVTGTLFWMLLGNMFEYHYVWQHSSTNLPLRYIFSCFWEGQEGSFLLWMIWHSVLGLLVIRWSGTWSMPVISVVSLVQVFLGSMLLGVYFLGYRIGSNPFLLLREHPDMMNLPFAGNPDYLETLDGRGLNPLLQNYWMTIHPPTLFLGFASTLIPFAFAIAGLWTRQYGAWIRPALPWTVFGVMTLGTGILMGGAWAYEALSFGGFWAWDPVENASLVPWLTFVAAMHVMLLYKAKQRSLLSALLLTCLTFVLILYSTFLTRSGILGDSSVHAFTDLGMSGQLLIYLLFFVVLPGALIAARWKHLRDLREEEHLWSREFWMFIAALVLFISSLQIITTTSIPVINKIFGQNMAPPTDPIAHYNAWQIAFAIIAALLVSVGQFMKYGKTNLRELAGRTALPFALALTAGLAAGWALQLSRPHYFVLLIASLFAIAANAHYLVRVLKGRVSKAGASIAHVGFGMILLGALIANAQQQVISQNTSAYDLDRIAEGLPNSENIMLVKSDTLRMGEYFVTFTGKRRQGVNVYYAIDYLEKSAAGGYRKAFTLEPIIQLNERMGNVAEPATKHFLHKDIYTHIQYANLEEFLEPDKLFAEAKKDTIGYGDTLFASRCFLILDTVSRTVDREKLGLTGEEIAAGIRLTAVTADGQRQTLEPVFVIAGDRFRFIEDTSEELGLRVSVTRIFPESEKFEVTWQEKNEQKGEFIILKAIVFPYINILWTGCVLLILGSLVVIRERVRVGG